MSNISKLVFYSIGIVAANKPLSSKDIEVFCQEDSQFANGEITDNAAMYSATAKDASGATYSASVATTVTIKATWLPINSSNRITAPDVRRGESVVIYKFADADKYYWNTLKDDSKLRKLETVIYAFSGSIVEGTTPGPDNTYFLEISTHHKLIHFHTSKANGEPYAYDIQINTAEGFIQIQDDDGNFFKFDSANQHLVLSNKNGSVLDLNKAVISIVSSESINIHSPKINTTGEITQQGNTTHNGNINLSGNLSMSPGAGGNGTAVISGDMQVQGTISSPNAANMNITGFDAGI